MGYEPGEFLIKLIKKRRRWYASKNKINSSRKIKPRKEKCEPDEDYGNVNDVTEEELLTRKETLLKSLAKTDEEIMEIERNTQGQSANPAWKQERAFRLTTSNFGSVGKRRSNTPPNKLVKQLLYGRFLGNAATRYGSEHEAIAIEDFQELTGFQVETCGIFIGKQDECFLGASPDGIVREENAIVEVKCPEKVKKISIEEAVNNKIIDFLKFDEDGTLKLKTNHNYHYQIQGQLHITDSRCCYFIVWSPAGSIHIEEIEKDPEFWKDDEK
ncbi:hypothetical protein NQ314_011397 [Rhamnusium bicolor]|uniref:YqaJ viral recombinase domain-containing protein n=1 Tax=Rhamnusium bicolor TaxID=1586634 RepID=A0AAV8XJ94_9CUCU|nr:hypothetical protein NQ314_011397 [Rhamnusium bicolor]